MRCANERRILTLAESLPLAVKRGPRMNNMPKPYSLLLLVALAPITLMLLSTNLCAQTATRAGPPQSSAASHHKTKRRG